MVCSYTENCLPAWVKEDTKGFFFFFGGMLGVLEAMTSRGMCHEKSADLKSLREGTQKFKMQEKQECWWRLTKPITK